MVFAHPEGNHEEDGSVFENQSSYTVVKLEVFYWSVFQQQSKTKDSDKIGVVTGLAWTEVGG